MEEEESVPALSRKELRKQKLMEYLAAKGSAKAANPKPYLREERPGKEPVKSAPKVVKGKENEAPFGKSKNVVLKCPIVAAETRQAPVRKVLTIANKGNISGRIMSGQKIAPRPLSSSAPTQPRCNLNPEFSRAHTVGSRLNPVSQVTKAPIAGVQTSNKAPLNAAHTFSAKPSNKLRSSKAAASGQMRSATARMSLGPFIKTRTGLIPAMIQPSKARTNETHTTTAAAQTNAATSTRVAKTLQSKSTSLGLASKAAPSVHSATLRDKVHGQKRVDAKPLPGKRFQPFKNNQTSQGLKSTSSHMSTAAPVKPQGKVALNKFAGPAADKATKSKSASEGLKIVQPCKAAPQSATKPASRCSSSWLPQAAAALERKSKASEESDRKQQTQRRTVGPVLSQTVPAPVRTVSFTGHASNAKTTKVPPRVVPQTEVKKLSAAQEERLRKLQEWREARGISYKRPPMPVKPPVRRATCASQPFWESMKKEDEAHSLMCAVDRSLADCIKLLGEGCPPEQVRGVLSQLPLSQKFAKYWICRARLMEQEGDLDVLPMFEEAVRVVLEPVDELREVVFEILKKKDENEACEQNEKGVEARSAENTPERDEDPMATPKPVRALIWGQRGDSSVIKYKITATPGGPASLKRESARVNGQEVRFFTPVRRSVRIEKASLRYPAALHDHDPCVASCDDLFREEEAEQEVTDRSPSDSDTPMYVYRENEALQDKVVVQLVCDDTA